MAVATTETAHTRAATSTAVGIWVRVSTEDQVRGESPEHHETRARYYAESKGWSVHAVYRLDGVSGKDVRSHAECQRMMDDVRHGKISALVFSKLARLARSTRDLLDFADFFREHDADLVSLEEAIDTSTPAGRLFYTMIAAMAQWEREEIASRVAASVPVRAKLGKSLGGAAPFGYQWQGHQLVPDPHEAPVRKLMCELFVEHRRVGTVARLLNDAGHRTRSGKLFGKTTVKRLLGDPTAKGVHRLNYTTARGESGVILKPESDWVLAEVEPVISEELWERCASLLTEREKTARRPARRPVQLFAGTTFCACGQKMYVPSNTPKYVCQKCRNKIPVDDLEAVFQEQLRNFVFSPDDIAAFLSSADEGIAERERELKVLDQDVADLRRRMGQVMRLFLDGQLSKDGFGREYGPLEERLKQLDDRIPEVQGELDFLKIQRLSSDEVLSEARDLYSRWPELERDEKRRIVEAITDRITIGEDEVHIDLAYLPSPSEELATKARNLCR
ncbi:recombinase family protein [bacterium]|nr:recombinase family protein [bacterium]